MAYVDLNPVRANMADSAEQSEYTSIFERINNVASREDKPARDINSKPLLAFVADQCNKQKQGIPYAFIDYFELVDWTGRIIRDDKRGALSEQRPGMLDVLGLESATWLELATHFGKDYHGAVGSLEELAQYAANTGKHWISGKTKLQRILH